MFTLRGLLALFRRRVAGPFADVERALGTGAFDDALRLLDAMDARSAHPRERAAIANKRGVVLVACGNRAEARSAFAAALTQLPRFAPARVNLGNLELEAGAFDAAIAEYEAALRAEPDFPGAYRHLGIAFKRLGRTDEAVRALKRADRLEGRKQPRLRL